MKILALSDLHLECNPFTPNPLAAQSADVVVLAGDIHRGAKGIKWARENFPDKPIVYVAGNHEFDYGHWTKTLDDLRKQSDIYDVNFLEQDSVSIGGIRFLGATLWTDFEFFSIFRRAELMEKIERSMCDFQRIAAAPLPQDVNLRKNCDDSDEIKAPSTRLTAKHTLQRHKETMRWLSAELPKGDPEKTVMISHHFPHQNSCTPQWKNEPLTAIFGSKISTKIMMGVKLWLHGHTHNSVDYDLRIAKKSMRVVCNPRGYSHMLKDIENKSFNQNLIIEI